MNAKNARKNDLSNTAAAHLNGVEESNRTAASFGGRLKNKKREKEKKRKKRYDTIRYDRKEKSSAGGSSEYAPLIPIVAVLVWSLARSYVILMHGN